MVPDGVRPFERDDVVAGYEAWYGTRYGRLADRLEREMLAELLEPLPSGARVLEVGCGTAWFGRWLRERGYAVVGVDASRRMLEEARRRVPVALAEAARLPFRDRTFDAAVLIAVLEFVDDPVAVLREARRVVRGRVVVIALASDSCLGLQRRLAAARGHRVFGAARFFSRAELLDLARATGAEPGRGRGALVLPPALASLLPGLEVALSSRRAPWTGLVSFQLPAAQP